MPGPGTKFGSISARRLKAAQSPAQERLKLEARACPLRKAKRSCYGDRSGRLRSGSIASFSLGLLLPKSLTLD